MDAKVIQWIGIGFTVIGAIISAIIGPSVQTETIEEKVNEAVSKLG